VAYLDFCSSAACHFSLLSLSFLPFPLPFPCPSLTSHLLLQYWGSEIYPSDYIFNLNVHWCISDHMATLLHQSKLHNDHQPTKVLNYHDCYYKNFITLKYPASRQTNGVKYNLLNAIFHTITPRIRESNCHPQTFLSLTQVIMPNSVAQSHVLLTCIKDPITTEWLRERTEHLDIFLLLPITQWCSISDVLFTGGRGVSDFSVLKYN